MAKATMSAPTIAQPTRRAHERATAASRARNPCHAAKSATRDTAEHTVIEREPFMLALYPYSMRGSSSAAFNRILGRSLSIILGISGRDVAHAHLSLFLLRRQLHLAHERLLWWLLGHNG